MRHPARFAPRLIKRILDEGFLRGWWSKGDYILDPFAGVATGGICAYSRGLKWVGIEIEPHFVSAAKETIDRWCPDPILAPKPIMLSGDSRFLGRFLTMEFRAIVTSPPYGDVVLGGNHERETAESTRIKRRTGGGSLGVSMRHFGYGLTEGNLSSLKIDEQMKHAKIVYSECVKCLSSDGVMVVVVKNYVRDNKIVDIVSMTKDVLSSCGLSKICSISAMLNKVTRQPGLFGEEVVEVKERKSFFKRLHESKGAPKIEEEYVLVFRRD